MTSGIASGTTPSPGIAAEPARILIVDDDAANREVLAIVLVNDGFLLVTAASGEEALAIAAQQPLDLILLDVILPDMSGYQVAAMLRGKLATKNIPIVMVTAMNDHATRTRALHAGVTDFLSKPVDRVELCRRVRKALLVVDERRRDRGEADQPPHSSTAGPRVG